MGKGEVDIALDVKVKVLYGTDEDDVISQYVTFTKVYDEQRKIHGRTLAAIQETLRICKDKNILREYLESREKEIVDMLLTAGRGTTLLPVCILKTSFSIVNNKPELFTKQYLN